MKTKPNTTWETHLIEKFYMGVGTIFTSEGKLEPNGFFAREPDVETFHGLVGKVG